MNLTLKHVVACYFIIFLMAMIFAGAGQILIITMDMSAVSEEAHRGLVAFSTKMADIVDYKIYGDDMQIVEIELDPGEACVAEAGLATRPG